MTGADDEEQRMQVDAKEPVASSSSSESAESDNDESDDGQSPPKVEWLATGREKRSTAGNRMKSMIAAEEPDDELELLFAEDGDDAGFTDVGDDGSDGHMSSSDDEDAQENGDELEGEMELEKQARESRQAARKRKAQEAIPQKFRKRVKIDTTQAATGASAISTAPKPRPKKKSERLSWLPTPADMPTRASRRETTIAGKEQLHKQMAEREIKRLKQLEAMERKAKKMEALKKPPMTQAERLAEAALVEKRNAKSLNRWEEAEKQREEERKAKLAALNTRTLKGPVVTFWSGVGEWVDGKLKHVGKVVTIEEKPAKKKRHSTVGNEGPPESSGKAISVATSDDASPEQRGANEPPPSHKTDSAKSLVADQISTPDVGSPVTGPTQRYPIKHSTSIEPGQEIQAVPASNVEKSPLAPPAPQVLTSFHTGIAPNPTGPQPKPLLSEVEPPINHPNFYTTSVFAPPPPMVKAHELKPPSNSFLAPPAGLPQSGLSMPLQNFNTSNNSTITSNVLAPPNAPQRQSPLSMPLNNIPIHPATLSPVPIISNLPRPSQVTPVPKPPNTTPSASQAVSSPARSRPPSKPVATSKASKGNAQKNQQKQLTPSSPPTPPANGKATRNCIILQNFNENAIKEKSVQNRILFNNEMQKLPRPGAIVRCVITNHPARYRDPKTGLPYHDAYAYKEIQKIYNGEYRWSSLVGAWSGCGIFAAAGVPARFVDPDAPAPPKEPAEPIQAADGGEAINLETHEMKSETYGEQLPNEPNPPTPQMGASAATDRPSSDTPTVLGRPRPEPGMAHTPQIAGEPSSGGKPYIPTTVATFALNTDHATSTSPTAVGNLVSQPMGQATTHQLPGSVNLTETMIPSFIAEAASQAAAPTASSTVAEHQAASQ
ncbi:YL1-domain-containing protein [Xylariaceae sp. FL0594]|nr:YL1-domain-containing protein [Xylariaceae sp. FL0594]